jgi:signal transduction histidine kinase
MPPEDLELIEDLLEETERMSDLLSELLLLARLDAGNLPVAREPFDLLTVLFDATDRFKARAEETDARLEVEGHANIPALGDAERTEQILSAVLDNALHFTPEKGKITVYARTTDGKAEVSVEDEGPGIPEEHLPHIFDRFYQVEEARNRKSGSTGLGLSIARDLARAQGGDLTASNSPSGGARFSLTLPLHEGYVSRKSGARLSKNP